MGVRRTGASVENHSDDEGLFERRYTSLCEFLGRHILANHKQHSVKERRQVTRVCKKVDCWRIENDPIKRSAGLVDEFLQGRFLKQFRRIRGRKTRSDILSGKSVFALRRL